MSAEILRIQEAATLVKAGAKPYTQWAQKGALPAFIEAR